LYRRFAETGGTVVVEEEWIVVQFDRRCHNPIVREAAPNVEPIPIPWGVAAQSPSPICKDARM
jgi:hypothetical protein